MRRESYFGPEVFMVVLVLVFLLVFFMIFKIFPAMDRIPRHHVSAPITEQVPAE